jgi:hypothetical protein
MTHSPPGPYIATRTAIALLTALAWSVPAIGASVFSLGPRGVQSLVADQLFTKHGKWYLIDDGEVCYTYLESPRTHLEADRLVLNAHMTSRLGQRVGNNCMGADLASNVTLSGRLRATDHKLLLDDIRIDHVDDDSTRAALALAQQLAPQALPHSVGIDVLELLRKQVSTNGVLPVHVDQFRILDLATRPDGVTIQVDLSLSTP